MRFLVALLLALALLAAAPAAWADVHWGADAFSAPKGSVNDAEAAMGTTFESYSLYSNLWRSKLMESAKMAQAMHENALVYININSETIGKKSGQLVPICWPDVAAGHRDGQLQAWVDAILATHYDRFIFTFNHEPMWASPQHPNCPKQDTPTSYRQAYNHVRKFFIAAGIDAPWAYVMTWGATKWAGGLLYRPRLANFDIIGTDQYYQCDDGVYPAADAFKSFFDWTAKYAPGKPVLVGEIGALTTCPDKTLVWLNAAKTRLEAHDVVAIDWNLRTNAGQEYNPLLNDEIKQWWLDWAGAVTGSAR